MGERDDSILLLILLLDGLVIGDGLMTLVNCDSLSEVRCNIELLE